MTTRPTGLSVPGPAAAGHAGPATLVLAARTNPETARALAALAGHENETGEGLFYSNGSGSETPLLVTATALAERDEATSVVNEGTEPQIPVPHRTRGAVRGPHNPTPSRLEGGTSDEEAHHDSRRCGGPGGARRHPARHRRPRRQPAPRPRRPP